METTRGISLHGSSAGLAATDVMETLDIAHERAGIDRVKVRHQPRLLPDNGQCYLFRDLTAYLEDRDMVHTHGTWYHLQTQGKIER